MKSLLLIFAAVLSTTAQLYAQCPEGETKINLDINNVNAHLRVGSALWHDDFGGYEVPFLDLPFDGPSVLYSGGLWIGGVTAAGELKLAAQEYTGTGLHDYSPGPLNSDGTTSVFNCLNWDRFWEMTVIEVEAHRNDFEDNGVIDAKLGSIYGWPGKANPHFLIENGFILEAEYGEMAPFVDVNGDGIYNPDDGDYPDIKGDKAIWWVFNDVGSDHTQSGGQQIGAQVNCLAYAYDTEVVAIDEASYYVFSIYNKGSDDLLDMYTGLWVDFDLGCFIDDRVAYDTTRQMVIAYNEDAVDGDGSAGFCPGGASTYLQSPPVVGIRLIEDSNNSGVTSLGVINYRGIGASPATTNPQVSNEYYNYLQGRWRDGQPFTLSADGYTGTDVTPYLGTNEYFETAAGMTVCNEEEVGDQRAIMSTSGGTLVSGGAPQVLKYAVVFSREQNYPCPDWSAIQEVSDVVAEEAIVATSTQELSSKPIALYPNPTNDQLTVEITASIAVGTAEFVKL